MKKVYFIFFLFVSITSLMAGSPEQYIQTYKNIAIAQMKRTHIPASILIAQGMLDSDFGQNELAQKANNHFKLFCDSIWTGNAYQKIDQDEKNEYHLFQSCFKVFESGKDAYIAQADHFIGASKMLKYGFLFEFHSNDYKSWADGLKQVKYRTDPNYANKIIKLIEKYKLDQFDLLLQSKTTHSQSIFRKAKEKKNDIPEEKLVVSKRYGIKCAKVFPGDTPRKIADRYQIHVDRLLNYNKGYEKDELLMGDNVMFLERKKTYFLGRKNHHTVLTGETMLTISQKYGVRAYILRQKNEIPENAEPIIGSKINLKRKNKYHKPQYIMTENG